MIYSIIYSTGGAQPASFNPSLNRALTYTHHQTKRRRVVASPFRSQAHPIKTISDRPQRATKSRAAQHPVNALFVMLNVVADNLIFGLCPTLKMDFDN